MLRKYRVLIIVLVVAILVALPTIALANKKTYKANLTTAAELHEVVDSTARGSAVFSAFPDGTVHFMISGQRLSGPVTGIHLHGPATASENAPVVLTLCGNPAPAAVSECTVVDGVLSVSGVIDSNLLAQWGLRARDFYNWMDNGLMYVNAHTSLNPAGEMRGQVAPR